MDMSFTATDVKNLREKTGAGMMDCKKALGETSGDFDKAVDWLRTKGLAAAAKKQSRIASEGEVYAIVEGNEGVVVEVNCETDFVSKGDDFKAFTQNAAACILKNKPSDVEALKNAKFANGLTMMENVQELTMKVGEKIDVRRFEIFSANKNTLGTYVHGGKIAVICELAVDNGAKDTKLDELMKDICMHITAADPKFISGNEIDEDFKNREAEIYTAQLKEQGKPENMITNIVQGKLNKLAKDVCLLEQQFVKNPDITVQALIDSVAKEMSTKISVVKFTKYNLGEGIEKKQDNLADEVAKMTKQ
jgi:elongation factor Ts